ncbi:MAG: fibronectin type III domain-containing protein, partial [Cyclobacteriaceae bacterium]|nr:fibronectin type III domain-containing protein [Cyclobacteriaceae bacterium]
RVSYRESGEATWLATVEVATTSYTPTGLVPGTTYEWAVRTLCDDIPTESSLVFGPDFTTTGSVVCDDPTNHTVTNLTNNSVTLSWDPAAGSVNYRIAYRRTTEPTWEQIIVQTDTSINLTGLFESSTYIWAVRNLCAQTDSDLIFGTNFTTLGGVPCDDPTNLQTSNITSSSVTLDWDAASGSVEYRIAYRPVNTGPWEGIIEQTGTTLNLAGLTAGTTYEWAVRNLCAMDETSDLIFGPDFVTLGGVTCEDPTNLQTSNIGSTTVTLTWDAAGGAVNYRIAYRPVNSGGSWEAIIEQPGTTLNATGLSSSTTYEWVVRTLCSGTETSDLIFGPEFTTSGTIDGSSAISINDKDDAGALLDADFRNSVHVYPNPSSGQFNIKVGTVSPNDQLVVYNALGKVLMTQRLESRSATLDLAGFGKGMYLVRVLNEERITSKTLIVR